MLHLSRRAVLLIPPLVPTLRALASSAPSPKLFPPASFEVVVIADGDSREVGEDNYISYLAQFVVRRVKPTKYELGSIPNPGENRKPAATNKGLLTVGPAEAAASTSAPAVACIPEPGPPGLRLITKYGYGRRGAEFSDLLLMPPPDRRLYTFDDRTGIVFEIVPSAQQASKLPSSGAVHQVLCSWELWHGRQLEEPSYSSVNLVPRWVLSDGAGDRSQGFKSEWTTLKDGKIWVGSHGYEVWLPGQPAAVGQGVRTVQHVKTIDPVTGAISHLDWGPTFNAIAAAVGVHPPGYITHEAATWSDIHQRWFFMPRRVSLTDAWDPINDQFRGSNLIISCKDGGQDVRVTTIRGETDTKRGFSSMRFVPGTGDTHIIATKTTEMLAQPSETYLTIVDIEGRVLMPETLVSDNSKYEGLEIIATSQQQQL